jgi:hypothetical protein
MMPTFQGTFRTRALTLALAAAALAGCYANNSPSSGSGLLNNLSKGTQLPPVVALALSPETVEIGQTATLTWSADGATSCIAAGLWSGKQPVSNKTGIQIGPFTTPGTFTASLTCTGSGGTGAASDTVTVGTVPAPSVIMDIEPSDIQPGNSAVVVWSTSNATSCVGSAGLNGWQGTEPTSNLAGFSTGTVQNAGAYQFDLTCTGPGGSTQVERTLTVSPTAPPAPPALVLAVQPSQIAPGQSAVLSWTATNSTTCSASGGTGSAWSGSEPVSGSVNTGNIATDGSYTFNLTCTGAGGMVEKSATLLVTPNAAPLPVSLAIDVSPSQIPSGGMAYLSWSTANANACVASGSWSGVEPVLGALVSTGTLTTPGTYSYTLTCTGPGGSAAGTAQLTVGAPPATVTALSATPSSITSGQHVSLSWASNDAASCTASGGASGDGWAGPQPTSSTGTSVGPVNTLGVVVYTLVCTGPGGTGLPQSVNVLVTPATPVPVEITAFAAVPPIITVGQSATLNWVTVGATACTASGGTGSWGGSVGTQSLGTSTGAINTAGSYTYTLTCTGPGGSNASSVSVNVVNAPSGPPIITSFTATPPTIVTGQSATLAWTTTGATACTASGAWSGSEPTSSAGTSTGTINTAGVYTYTLTCTGTGGTSLPVSAILAVANSANAAAVTSFTATPPTVEVGQPVELAWTTQNASSCAASGAWSGPEPISSTGTSGGSFASPGLETFTLTCTGTGGSAGPASVSVLVTPATSAPASIVAFAVTPATIETGQSALLSWVTLDATSCTASGGTGSWSGSVPVTGVAVTTGTINTAGSYTYTLTCTGPGGASPPSSVVLNVTSAPPPLPSISLFTAVPNTVQTGQSVLLTWASTSATSCAASGGASGDGWNGTTVAAIGTETVGPLNTQGTYTYTLTCSGPGGTSPPMSVTVDVNSTPPAPAITSFTVSPATLATGGTATAAWATTGASACTASGGTPGDGWSGSVGAQSSGTSIGPIDTIGVATYVLTCTGAGGTSLPASASVVVTPTAPPAAVTSFTAAPTAIQTGQSATLTWTSSNATSCTASGGTNSWGGPVNTSSTGTSTGAINTAGTYIFGLTCTGPGGTSLPAAATVIVTTTPPPVSITSFAATPANVQVGQSTSLSWTTNGASACTATGGTGADGWGGVVGPSSTGTTVGPFNSAGTVTYTLLCTGLGGISTPSSINVTVSPATPAATIGSFTVTPSAVQAGQSVSLAWTSSNATTCSAGGGTGSDGWTGSVGTSSTGLSVGPLNNPGTVTYTLTCRGPGGTSAPSSVNVTVNPITPPAPAVTLVANGSNPAQVQPGGSITLSWTSSNATSCSASGGSGGWSGAQPTSSSGVSVTSIAIPGIYTYTLSCSGPGGTGSSTVQITVISAQSYDCGIPGTPTSALAGSAATVSTSASGVCLLGSCSVSNPGNVIDSNPDNYATMVIPLGIGGSTSLEVADTATFPPGRKVGFIIANGTSLLDASLLGAVEIQTLLNGTVQETAATTGLPDVIQVQAAGLLGVDQYSGYAEFTTTKSFNAVQIVAGSLVGLDSTIKVYSACVSQQ